MERLSVISARAAVFFTGRKKAPLPAEAGRGGDGTRIFQRKVSYMILTKKTVSTVTMRGLTILAPLSVKERAPR